MKKAAQKLVVEALPSITRTAQHLAAVYRPAHADADDLASVGYLAVCEALQRGIKPKGNKIGYVVVIARRAMMRYCGIHRSLIKTPRTANGYQPALVVLSLDAPLSADSDATLLDLLADGDDYSADYDAYLDSLPL